MSYAALGQSQEEEIFASGGTCDPGQVLDLDTGDCYWPTYEPCTSDAHCGADRFCVNMYCSDSPPSPPTTPDIPDPPKPSPGRPRPPAVSPPLPRLPAAVSTAGIGTGTLAVAAVVFLGGAYLLGRA